MIKLLIRMNGNNNYTTVALEMINDQQTGTTYFYWRKINECRTRFVGVHVSPFAWKAIYDEVARLTDGTFVGILER